MAPRCASAAWLPQRGSSRQPRRAAAPPAGASSGGKPLRFSARTVPTTRALGPVGVAGPAATPLPPCCTAWGAGAALCAAPWADRRCSGISRSMGKPQDAALPYVVRARVAWLCGCRYRSSSWRYTPFLTSCRSILAFPVRLRSLASSLHLLNRLCRLCRFPSPRRPLAADTVYILHRYPVHGAAYASLSLNPSASVFTLLG